jgi:phosphopantetheine--protein transferase-like protein
MTDQIYWTVTRDDQTPTLDPSVPFETFLTPYELERLSAFRFPKRRSEWLHGRWSIKYLLRHSAPGWQDLAGSRVQVKNEAEGMPFLEDASTQVRLPLQISINHREHNAFCAITTAAALKVGVDLELVENRPPSFLEDYFTSREYTAGLEYHDLERDVYFTLLWSLKESVLKALGKGLRLDTRRVEITEIEDLSGALQDPSWRCAQVVFAMNNAVQWRLWWRYLDHFIFSVAACFSQSAAAPELYEVPPGLE